MDPDILNYNSIYGHSLMSQGIAAGDSASHYDFPKVGFNFESAIEIPIAYNRGKTAASLSRPFERRMLT